MIETKKTDNVSNYRIRLIFPDDKILINVIF